MKICTRCKKRQGSWWDHLCKYCRNIPISEKESIEYEKANNLSCNTGYSSTCLDIAMENILKSDYKGATTLLKQLCSKKFKYSCTLLQSFKNKNMGQGKEILTTSCLQNPYSCWYLGINLIQSDLKKPLSFLYTNKKFPKKILNTQLELTLEKAFQEDEFSALRFKYAMLKYNNGETLASKKLLDEICAQDSWVALIGCYARNLLF